MGSVQSSFDADFPSKVITAEVKAPCPSCRRSRSAGIQRWGMTRATRVTFVATGDAEGRLPPDLQADFSVWLCVGCFRVFFDAKKRGRERMRKRILKRAAAFFFESQDCSLSNIPIDGEAVFKVGGSYRDDEGFDKSKHYARRSRERVDAELDG